MESRLKGVSAEKPPEEFNSEVAFYEGQLERGNLDSSGGRLSLMVDGERKIIVPRGMRKLIFGFAHSHEFAGHLGVERTRKRIRESYFWFRSSQDISRWKSECLTCARHDVKRQAPHVSSKTVPVKGSPLSQWAMDVLGPLPRSRRDNQFVLVLTDRFTKWVELYALPDQRTERIVACLIDLVCRYSVPSEILSDNGSNFSSRCFKALLNSLQIRQIQTTPYHAAGNGQTERFNATLMQALRKYVEESPQDWDDKLQTVAFSYRTSRHSVTGYSPYQLVFGRKPREPVHLVIEPGDSPPTEPLENFRKAEEWRRDALQRIEAEQMSRSEDVRSVYEVGDYVMLKNLKPKNKLSPKYRGPFVVKEIRNPYYVLDVDGKNKAVHGIHLKLFLTQGEGSEIIDVSAWKPSDSVEVNSQDCETDDSDQEPTEDWLIESDDSEEDDEPQPTPNLEGEPEVMENQVEEARNEEQGDARDHVSGENGALQFIPATSSKGRIITKNSKYM